MLTWIRIGSFVLFFAVALGAFGSHGLKNKLDAYSLDVYKTAVMYHFFHGLALFVVAWLSTATQDPKITWAGISFLTGIILFSGSLYTLSLTGIKVLGAITPLGGLAFLLGWVFILLTK